MNYAVLVEGPDDDRFIESVIKSEVNHRRFSTIQYSEEPDDMVTTAIRAFQGMHRDIYLLRDFDCGNQNCTNVSDRKDFVEGKFGSVNSAQIIVVKDAIEAWYLAGLSDTKASELGIQIPDQTDHIGKSEFDEKLQSSNSNSKIDFHMEILERYSISEAKRKNTSFEYFSNLIGI